jgi:dihydrofolate reductase
MRTVIARIFDYSIDGVMATENTPFFDFCRELPEDLAQYDHNRALYTRADLHIMGRVAYLGGAEYFPTATATDHPYADVMNAARKVVFSRTLTSADWANTTIASGSLDTELDALKQGGDGTIIAHGGVSFWKSLIERDLIDEYRITVFPYLAGTGTRLFEDITKSPRLELMSAIPFKDGSLEITYRRTR